MRNIAAHAPTLAAYTNLMCQRGQATLPEWFGCFADVPDAEWREFEAALESQREPRKVYIDLISERSER